MACNFFFFFRVVTLMHGTTNYEYLDINRELSPWARSMHLQYDA